MFGFHLVIETVVCTWCLGCLELYIMCEILHSWRMNYLTCILEIIFLTKAKLHFSSVFVKVWISLRSNDYKRMFAIHFCCIFNTFIYILISSWFLGERHCMFITVFSFSFSQISSYSLQRYYFCLLFW